MVRGLGRLDVVLLATVLRRRPTRSRARWRRRTPEPAENATRSDGDVLRLLAVRAPGWPIVLVSGASAEVVSDAHRRAASYGLRVVGSLRKPFDLSAFRVVLSRCRNAVSA